MWLINEIFRKSQSSHRVTRSQSYVLQSRIPISEVLTKSDYQCDIVRRTSSALFTAILYAGSRRVKPSSSSLLLSHAAALCNRATELGVIGLGTLQALCLLTFLRSPRESSWLRLGIAVRAAFQMGLHKRPYQGLGNSMRQADQLVGTLVTTEL